MTGTAAELAPVSAIDGRTIGEACPGPLTQRLIEAYRAAVRPSPSTESTQQAAVTSQAAAFAR
jgi:hypothetical protein